MSSLNQIGSIRDLRVLLAAKGTDNSLLSPEARSGDVAGHSEGYGIGVSMNVIINLRQVLLTVTTSSSMQV